MQLATALDDSKIYKSENFIFIVFSSYSLQFHRLLRDKLFSLQDPNDESLLLDCVITQHANQPMLVLHFRPVSYLLEAQGQWEKLIIALREDNLFIAPNLNAIPDSEMFEKNKVDVRRSIAKHLLSTEFATNVTFSMNRSPLLIQSLTTSWYAGNLKSPNYELTEKDLETFEKPVFRAR